MVAAVLSISAAFVGNVLGAINVPSADFPRPEHPQLGVNLECLLDYSKSMMFVDAMKAARRFGSPDAPWDEKAPVGPDGWPTGDAGAVVMTDVPVQPGDYSFSCAGRCELSTPVTGSTIRNLAYDRSKNVTTATITIPPATDHFFIALKNTQGGVKNIRLNRPGYPLSSKQVFTKEFLKAIEPFSTLRLMDLLRTNYTDAVHWSDRTQVDAPSQATNRGVAWEYAIMLANQTGKDLWINIPDQADDDYVRELATLMKLTLNKDRCIYIEYSNEVWNSIFPQYGHNIAAAEKEVAAGNLALKDDDRDNNKWYWSWRRTAERLIQISDIFRSVYGNDAMMTHIRPVLASQSAYSFILKMQLNFIENHYGAPARFIYGIAGAPYIGPEAKYVDRDDLTLDQMFKPGFEEALVGWVKRVTMEYQTLAVYYRVHSLCYEGGIGLEGEHSLKTKIAANHDPRIQKVVETYLDNWYSQGGELFMYFNLCGTYTKFGCWGLTDDIHKLNEPKMKGAILITKEPMPPITAGAAVPGKFMAAEAFTSAEGGKVEPDNAGGKDIGYLQDRNTVDFLLNVKQEGDYALSLQTGTAEEGAHLEMLLSGLSVGTVNCSNTGDWHKWSISQPMIVHLQRGQLVLRLRVVGKGPNVRMIDFQKMGG